MNNANEQLATVTRTLVPEDQRLSTIESLFGHNFPLQIEPIVFGITERMAEAYHGAYWNFYILDNGGFYLAPDDDGVFKVSCDNYFTGELSADALGITSCLSAYSHLSFSRDESLGRLCARHYHLLREYMYEHAEVAAILGAID